MELDLNTLNNEVKSYVLRTSLSIFKVLEPSKFQSHTVAIINGFEYFFGELSNGTTDHDKYMSEVNWLTNIRNMKVMISLIIGSKEECFVLEAWLRNMTVNLIKTLSGSLPLKQETRRKLFVDLTGALLFYVDAEMQRRKNNNITNDQSGESEWFLQQCMELKCFSGIEYIEGFKILQKFVVSLRYDGQPKEKSNTHIAMNDSLTQLM